MLKAGHGDPASIYAGSGSKCPHCEKILLTRTGFYGHLKTHTSKKYKCNECGAAAKNRETLKVHQVTTGHIRGFAMKIENPDSPIEISDDDDDEDDETDAETTKKSDKPDAIVSSDQPKQSSDKSTSDPIASTSAQAISKNSAGNQKNDKIQPSKRTLIEMKVPKFKCFRCRMEFNHCSYLWEHFKTMREFD
jgi:DNA-directed RNA polymerase subunit RPC12/RpoP